MRRCFLHLSHHLVVGAALCGPQCLAADSEVDGTLNEKVVVGSRVEESNLELAGSVVKKSADDLLKRGVTGLVDALQREPGVSVPLDIAGTDGLVPYLQGGNNSINIRGLEGNRVNLMVDGIRQPEDFTARSFLGSGGPGRIYFDPSVLASIEVFKSATSSLYGSDALAGTVATQTEGPRTLLDESLSGRAFRFNSNYETQNNSWSQRVAGAFGNGRHAASFVYSYRTGNELENNSDQEPNPLEFESHAFVLKSLHRIGDWTFEPTVDSFRQTSSGELLSLLGSSQIGETLLATSDALRTRERVSLSATWNPEAEPYGLQSLVFRGYTQNSFSGNVNDQQVRVNPGAINEFIRDRRNDLSYQTDIIGFDLQAEHLFEGRTMNRLSYGYEFSVSDVESALLRTDSPMAPQNLLNMAPTTVWRNGLYLNSRFTFGDRGQWVISPALRVDDYRVDPENSDEFLNQTEYTVFDEFGRIAGTESVRAQRYENLAFAPSLRVQYWLDDDSQVYASWAQGVRNPSAEELTGVFQHEEDFITLPNPDLEEERSQSFEVGYKRDGRIFQSSASVYYNSYEGFLESAVPTGEFLDGLEIQRTVNRDEATIYGIELQTEAQLGQWNPALDGFRVGASFSWAEGTTDSPVDGEQPLNTIEPWKANLWVGYLNPEDQWGVELFATYFAAKDQDDIAGDIPATDAYTLVDLTGFYRLGENSVLRGGVRNLLDQEYVIWSRANRGSGHNGGARNGRFTQPGINAFLGLEFEF